MAFDIEQLTADAERAMELQEFKDDLQLKKSVLSDIKDEIEKEFSGIVNCCLDIIEQYNTWDYQCYKNAYQRINSKTKVETRETMALLSAHLDDMMMFDHDTWQMKAVRDAKLLEYKTNKEQTMEDTMLYGLFGTYRSYCKYFYNFAFRIGMKIQEYTFMHNDKYLDIEDLDNEVRALCLYAALKHEL
ncbi:MAG: hypothetical protein LUC91_03675 [Prevotella sp.]|nr:hypothetical protein [Prevotella sp.]